MPCFNRHLNSWRNHRAAETSMPNWGEFTSIWPQSICFKEREKKRKSWPQQDLKPTAQTLIYHHHHSHIFSSVFLILLPWYLCCRLFNQLYSPLIVTQDQHFAGEGEVDHFDPSDQLILILSSLKDGKQVDFDGIWIQNIKTCKECLKYFSRLSKDSPSLLPF